MNTTETNRVREALTTEGQTVPTLKRITGLQVQELVDALGLLRSRGEARCDEAQVDGRVMTVWVKVEVPA